MKMSQWAIVSDPFCPYKDPDQIALRLQGVIHGHPHRKDGDEITTSRIVGKTEDGHVKTKSGSVYELGKVSDVYEALYPNALNRLMSTLPTIQ